MTGQIDYFFLFASAAAAQADPTVGAYWDATNLVWRGDVCFPGLKIVTSQALVNGISTANRLLDHDLVAGAERRARCARQLRLND